MLIAGYFVFRYPTGRKLLHKLLAFVSMLIIRFDSMLWYQLTRLNFSLLLPILSRIELIKVEWKNCSSGAQLNDIIKLHWTKLIFDILWYQCDIDVNLLQRDEGVSSSIFDDDNTCLIVFVHCHWLLSISKMCFCIEYAPFQDFQLYIIKFHIITALCFNKHFLFLSAKWNGAPEEERLMWLFLPYSIFPIDLLYT